MPDVSRHLQVAIDEADDLNAALAWAVNTVDTEFKTANMIHINVEQIMRMGGDESEWRYVWTAAVSGSIDKDGPR
jgi:hypothetical protein